MSDEIREAFEKVYPIPPKVVYVPGRDEYCHRTWPLVTAPFNATYKAFCEAFGAADDRANLQCNFTMEKITPEVVLLKDQGPWDKYRTITNAAQNVVQFLHRKQMLVSSDTQIIYIDSSGEYCELYHDGIGNFEGFGFSQPD